MDDRSVPWLVAFVPFSLAVAFALLWPGEFRYAVMAMLVGTAMTTLCLVLALAAIDV